MVQVCSRYLYYKMILFLFYFILFYFINKKTTFLTKNFPGFDFMGDKLFCTYVDKLISFYLKQEPILSSIPTFSLGEGDTEAMVEAIFHHPDVQDRVSFCLFFSFFFPSFLFCFVFFCFLFFSFYFILFHFISFIFFFNQQ